MEQANPILLADRLADLSPKTIKWLSQLEDENIDNLEWLCDQPKEKLDRFDQFISMSKEKFEAGFKIVELWTRMAWLGKTGFWLMSGIVAILMFFSQIKPFIASLWGGTL